MNFVMLVLLQL